MIAINYSWWFATNEKRAIPSRFEALLEDAAMNRIFEQLKEGWCHEGELSETLYDGRKPVEFRGWWKFTKGA